MNDPAPNRRLHLLLDLHADDLDEIRRVLEQIALDFIIEPRENIDNLTSAGWASGHHLTLKCDPAMDHDKYIAALDAWLVEDRKTRAGSVVSLPETQETTR